MTHGSPLAYSPTQAPDPHLICILCVDNQVNVITPIRMSEIHFQRQIQNTQISYRQFLQNETRTLD